MILIIKLNHQHIFDMILCFSIRHLNNQLQLRLLRVTTYNLKQIYSSKVLYKTSRVLISKYDIQQVK